MKLALRLLLLAFVPIAAACANNPQSPTAPSALAVDHDPLLTSAAKDGIATPFHILHPVQFGMIQGKVVFPPRNEPNTFFQDLQALYRDTLRRTQTTTYVDPEGENVWLTEYFRFYLNGCSHAVAMARTIQEITTAVTQPTCGSETTAFPPRNLPNEFQAQLEATYRDVLRRPQTLSYVDSEGANVWLAQYLRLRTSGLCAHATAEAKVFTEIRGGGVQPDCAPPFSRTGIGNTVFDLPSGITRLRIAGTYTGFSSNFVVYVGGRLIVNDLLGTGWGQTTSNGTYLVSGTTVEIRLSGQVSWTIEEVR